MLLFELDLPFNRLSATNPQATAQNTDQLPRQRQSTASNNQLEDPNEDQQNNQLSDNDDGKDNVDQTADQQNSEQNEDPNKQGNIRTVDGAHLVSKKQSPDGTYTELWMYKNPRHLDEIKIRKAILAGTDIKDNSMRSEDGSQTYEIWTIGNVEMIQISGVPS